MLMLMLMYRPAPTAPSKAANGPAANPSSPSSSQTSPSSNPSSAAAQANSVSRLYSATAGQAATDTVRPVDGGARAITRLPRTTWGPESRKRVRKPAAVDGGVGGCVGLGRRCIIIRRRWGVMRRFWLREVIGMLGGRGIIRLRLRTRL